MVRHTHQTQPLLPVRRGIRWSEVLITGTTIVERLEDHMIDELFYQEDEIGEMRHTAFMVECGLEEDPPDGPDVPPVPWGDMLIDLEKARKYDENMAMAMALSMGPVQGRTTARSNNDSDNDNDNDSGIYANAGVVPERVSNPLSPSEATASREAFDDALRITTTMGSTSDDSDNTNNNNNSDGGGSHPDEDEPPTAAAGGTTTATATNSTSGSSADIDIDAATIAAVGVGVGVVDEERLCRELGEGRYRDDDPEETRKRTVAAAWIRLRDSVSIGRGAHRFGDHQLFYHYTKDPKYLVVS